MLMGKADTPLSASHYFARFAIYSNSLLLPFPAHALILPMSMPEQSVSTLLYL